MKETLSIGGKDEFKVIEVPSPFPPGIKTEIKKIMDGRHMSDKEKHRRIKESCFIWKNFYVYSLSIYREIDFF